MIIYLAIVILIAFAVRSSLVFVFKSYKVNPGNDNIDTGWSFGYETGRIAKALASGKGFSSPMPHGETGPTAWLMPIYPLFLSGIFKLFGIYTTSSAILTLIINCLFSALIVVPLFYLAQNLFGSPFGHIASFFYVIHPSSIWHSINTIWDTTLFALMALILIWWLFKLKDNRKIWKTVFFGLFFGMTALTNAVILAFLPAVLLWLFIRSPLCLKNRFLHISVIIVGIFLVLFPWLTRNYFVFNKPMLRSNFGLELKIGNNFDSWTGNIQRPTSNHFWLASHPSINKNEFQKYAKLGEIKYMDQCFREASEFISENPLKFIDMTFNRIITFWFGFLRDNNDWTGNLKISLSISNFKKLTYFLPVPFMLLGIFLALKKKIDIFPLIGYLLLVPLVYYITNVTNRYRFPVEPVVFLFAIYGFFSLPVINRLTGRVRSIASS